jgi:hypothetical protein
MNLQERLLAVFSGKKPDVMPWFGDLTYWYRAKLYQNELPSKYLGEQGQIRLYRDLGCGSHEELYNLPGELTYYNVKRANSVEPFRDGTILYEDGYHTPLGNIVAVRKFVKIPRRYEARPEGSAVHLQKSRVQSGLLSSV